VKASGKKKKITNESERGKRKHCPSQLSRVMFYSEPELGTVNLLYIYGWKNEMPLSYHTVIFH